MSMIATLASVIGFALPAAYLLFWEDHERARRERNLKRQRLQLRALELGWVTQMAQRGVPGAREYLQGLLLADLRLVCAKRVVQDMIGGPVGDVHV